MIKAMKQMVKALEGMASDLGKFESEVPAIAAGRQALAEAKRQAPIDSSATEGGARYQADQNLRALLRYTGNFYNVAIKHGMKAGETANAIAHIEKAGRALHGLVYAWSNVAEQRQTQPKAEQDKPAIDTTPQPKQEEQEPVAVVTGMYGGRFIVEPTNSAMVLPVNMALYTHPQPRKPLTDEQKKSISRRAFKDICKDYPVQDRIIRVIEDIEAAHGIKE